MSILAYPIAYILTFAIIYGRSPGYPLRSAIRDEGSETMNSPALIFWSIVAYFTVLGFVIGYFQ